ncbi:hypothetical protein [Alkaliphilus serpentinus]|uniref:CopZ zinc binding domain-containing protein n=1 Tax=Alkaliphilus serpentinus TaxID=1482731 RepID=A0A833HP11_9FIRM|nr:hypothetical protein [Alkaliphilus serpentinus]KAB3530237.1 hypothetical protein F8153_07410 [Alkaliphilus serpentinus]
MGCCNNNYGLKKTMECPLCKASSEAVHYIVVETVLKKKIKNQVIPDSYYTCSNEDCDMVFFSEDHQQMFLTQDIDFSADFNKVIKTHDGCSGGCGGCGKGK